MQLEIPWWELGGEAMCLSCIKKVLLEDEEIYGGYRIETDKPPLCPGCGCPLDLIYIGDNPNYKQSEEEDDR